MLSKIIVEEPFIGCYVAYRFGSDAEDPHGYSFISPQNAIQDLYDEEEFFAEAADEMAAADCAYADSLEVDA